MYGQIYWTAVATQSVHTSYIFSENVLNTIRNSIRTVISRVVNKGYDMGVKRRRLGWKRYTIYEVKISDKRRHHVKNFSNIGYTLLNCVHFVYISKEFAMEFDNSTVHTHCDRAYRFTKKLHLTEVSERRRR